MASSANQMTFKGATSRFVHLEKFSLNFSIRHLQSVLILSILVHPRSVLVYSYLFGVCLPWETIILRFPYF